MLIGQPTETLEKEIKEVGLHSSLTAVKQKLDTFVFFVFLKKNKAITKMLLIMH